MKNKNRDDLLHYIFIALHDNEFMSYSEIVEDIEHNQNVSLLCYDDPIAAIKSAILDYGMYNDGEFPDRYNGKLYFLANDKKDRKERIEKQIKWKKINY